jgi:hypothetical protein
MKPTFTREMDGGVQEIYRFDNGYGASKIKTNHSYGSDYDLWEIAVIKFNGDNILNFKLCYETHITNDVIGHLNYYEAEKVLKQIKELA